MGLLLRLFGCGICMAVGAGTAWLALTLGIETVLGGPGLLAVGALIGLAAPWLFAFAGRQLGTSGEVAERYEQDRRPRQR